MQRVKEYGEQGEQVKGDMSLMSLCAMPVPDLKDFRLLQHAGVLQARVDLRGEEIAAFIAEQGPAVARALRNRKLAAQSLHDLRKRVELRLRLRQLNRSPQLSQECFEAGCYRMLDHQWFLLDYLEGAVVQLGEQNCVVAGQHMVTIAWNFHA